MDLGILGQIHFNLETLLAFMSILVINLILSGDNAVVIAMAVRTLPHKQRVKGIFWGAAAAVVLRIVLTFFVMKLLNISFLKFIGGAVILWIAIKLFIEGAGEEGVKQEAKSITQAVWVILVADLTMSIDNVLAVAGAAKGNLFLLIVGLTISIFFVMFASNLLAMLMDKYPIIVYFGAAILGKVSGEMMIGDAFVERLLHPSKWLVYGVEAFFAIAVIVVGKLWLKWKNAKEEEKEKLVSHD